MKTRINKIIGNNLCGFLGISPSRHYNPHNSIKIPPYPDSTVEEGTFW
jgi:hypothetical protein